MEDPGTEVHRGKHDWRLAMVLLCLRVNPTVDFHIGISGNVNGLHHYKKT